MRLTVRVGRLGAVICACVLVSSCTEDAEVRDVKACAAQEAVGYADMEAEARSVLDGVDFSLAKAGSCEDTGRPWSRLTATVVEWRGRHAANRHLVIKGWVRAERGFLSPDGAYRADTTTARDSTLAAESFVLVTFEEVVDEQGWVGGSAE